MLCFGDVSAAIPDGEAVKPALVVGADSGFHQMSNTVTTLRDVVDLALCVPRDRRGVRFVIVVAGEALIDLVLAVDGSVSAKLGGGPFNVARTLGRLGAEVSFLGTISTDRFGTQLFDQLHADRVDPVATVRTDSPTTLAAAELDPTGSARYRFYFNGTSAPALDEVPSGLDHPAAVHVGTLGLVLEPMATTVVAYVAALAPDVLVMADPNCREHVITDRDEYLRRVGEVYARSHIVKISTDDAAYLSPNSAPIEYARSLVVADARVRVVLLTDGGNGTWVVSADAETVVAPGQITVADTIGAGDSFGGAFIGWWITAGFGVAELADHALVVQATRAASEVAAITCQRVGADPPWLHELPPHWGT